MKHLIKLVMSILLAQLALLTSGIVAAQEKPDFPPGLLEKIAAAFAAGTGEQVYVLYSDNVETISVNQSPERVMQLCNFMLKSGFEPEFPAFNVAYVAYTSNLYSLTTASSLGRVVNPKVKKVGESIACTGDETTDQVIVPGVYLDTTEFPNGVPSAKANQAIEVTIGSQTFYALGSLGLRTDPVAGGIPYPNFLLATGSFTLHKMVDDPEPGWDVVGTYTSNLAVPVAGLPATAGEAGGIATLRVSPSGYFVPRYILVGGN